MAMEPKHEIYKIQPAAFTPQTLFFNRGTGTGAIMQAITNSGMAFPLIIKPDIGMKGLAVARINNEAELKSYQAKAGFDFIIQQLIDFPNEAGIFYSRYPGSAKGQITGIVKKEFLSVTGDGTSTIAELIAREPRFALQTEALKLQYGEKLNEVLPATVLLNLVPFGNHARGAKFIDASHLISPQLTDTLDKCCAGIPGFNYGRLDIRYNTFEELEQGKNFSIIELNGAGADPTHMFDPSHSLFFAWKEIAKHWKIMYRISALNHRQGTPYLSLKEGTEMLRKSRAHVKILEAF